MVARISRCPDIFDVKRNFMVTVRRTGTFLVTNILKETLNTGVLSAERIPYSSCVSPVS